MTADLPKVYPALGHEQQFFITRQSTCKAAQFLFRAANSLTIFPILGLTLSTGETLSRSTRKRRVRVLKGPAKLKHVYTSDFYFLFVCFDSPCVRVTVEAKSTLKHGCDMLITSNIAGAGTAQWLYVAACSAARSSSAILPEHQVSPSSFQILPSRKSPITSLTSELNDACPY